MRDPAGYPQGVDKPRKFKFMTVAELIKTLEALLPDAPVALRTILPDQRIRWDDIGRVELRGPIVFRRSCSFGSWARDLAGVPYPRILRPGGRVQPIPGEAPAAWSKERQSGSDRV